MSKFLSPMNIGGDNDLPFINYEKNRIEFKNVRVVYDNFGSNDRMQVIIVENNGKYQDFYYNDAQLCFKPLSESSVDNMSPADWWAEEEINSPCPDWFNEVTEHLVL